MIGDDVASAAKKRKLGHKSKDYVVVPVEIVSSPAAQEDGFEASNVLEDEGSHWCSKAGECSNACFTFEAPQSYILALLAWKGPAGEAFPRRLPRKLLLEAQVGDSWTELATWDSQMTADWQSQTINTPLRSRTWRLTLIENHGHSHYLCLEEVRFLAWHTTICPVGAKLWLDSTFTDVEVLVGERRFRAHRAVLAAASPVFSAMLRTGMQETTTGEIRLEDADEQSVHATLKYIYTGLLSEDAHFGVVLLAHRYDIDGLAEAAGPVAVQNVTVENVVPAFRMLKPHAKDARLGVFWQQLQDLVQESRELLAAVVLAL